MFGFQSPIAAKPLEASGEAASYNINTHLGGLFFWYPDNWPQLLCKNSVEVTNEHQLCGCTENIVYR